MDGYMMPCDRNERRWEMNCLIVAPGVRVRVGFTTPVRCQDRVCGGRGRWGVELRLRHVTGWCGHGGGRSLTTRLFVQTQGEEKGRALEGELEQLVALVAEPLRDSLLQHEEIQELVEIVLDLGRRPVARFPSGDWPISEQAVSAEDLARAVAVVGDFAEDNRAGIDRTLHRVSAIRNRGGKIVGLTCRVGRAISGSAEMVRDLVAGGGSLLLMGPPGVGKTTAIREVARVLADEYARRVVVVDTSNEIGGDGDIAHPGIGRARRMQVARVEMQHHVMIEAVENHMPQTIVIDEIGTEREAAAAGTIAQRGVQLVATAHGMTVDNLIKNPSLQSLAGGIQSVTLGDEEARRRGVQKSVLERMGPPTFTAAVEMASRSEWRVHRSLAATVDALLAGRTPQVEVRRMTDTGQVIASSAFVESQASQDGCSGSDGESDEEGLEDEDYVAGRGGKGWGLGDPPLKLFAYQVTEAALEQVVEVMGLEKAVQLTDDIGAADAVLALRSKLKQNSWVRGMAKFRQLPIFAIKANTMAQMVRALRAILGMETLVSNAWVSSDALRERDAEQQSRERGSSSTSEERIDALEEARQAIERIVIPRGQPVELLPRSIDVIGLQEKLAEGYQLATEKAGSDAKLRLRILPSHASAGGASLSAGPALECEEDGKHLSSTGGTSVSRLPILPD